MDSLLFHPRLVHIPLALGMLMPLVAGGLLLAWRRDWLPARAWAVAVTLQAVLFLSGLGALASGDAEEERVERVVEERFIEEHERAAQAFVWLSAGVFGIMLVALAHPSERAGRKTALIATLGTLVVLGFAYRTGQAGGNLVYRHGAAEVYVKGASTSHP